MAAESAGAGIQYAGCVVGWGPLGIIGDSGGSHGTVAGAWFREARVGSGSVDLVNIHFTVDLGLC